MTRIKFFTISLSIAFIILSCNSSGQNTENELIDKDADIKSDSAGVEENADNNKSVSLIFLGDIMQHDLQIQSAYNKKSGKYDFSSQFKYVKAIFDTTDIVIGNLEVTFGGKPYKGYPKFSSPDALAYDIKKSGIDYLATATNHIYDKGKAGFEKTLKLLDKVGIKRTGAFINKADKKKNHPMIIDKNGFKLALFNYTYGLNDGIVFQKPSIVNMIDEEAIKKDLKSIKDSIYDGIIVFFHWGVEYKHKPDDEQKSLVKLCLENGANIVIGSHPHVINRMEQYEYISSENKKKDVLVAYSLGNFVSNYGTWRYCDGGNMIKFELSKDKDNKLKISNSEYILVWVYRPVRAGKLRNYYVVPVTQFEKNNQLMDSAHKKQMKRFIDDSRLLLDKENVNVSEWKYTK